MYGGDDRDDIIRMSAELRGRSFLARAEATRINAHSKKLITESAGMRYAAHDLRQDRSCP